MSNDMKLIMEGWRRTLKENNKQEELDEAAMSRVFAGLLAIAGMGDAMAKDLDLGGGDRIELKIAAKGLKDKGDTKSANLASKLADILQSNPPDNDNDKAIDVTDAGEVGANTLDDAEIELLKSLKAGPSPADGQDGMSMQQRIRKANQDAFKSGKGGLGPMQEKDEKSI